MAVPSSSPSSLSTARPDSQMEIRHLSPNVSSRLSHILDSNDSWKILASSIPHPDSADTPLLCARDISMLEEARGSRNSSPTLSLLQYWGTFGRNRPRLQTLLDLLTSCQLLRAAHFLAVEVLGQAPPVVESVNIVQTDLPDNPGLVAREFEVPHYDYGYLEKATQGFCAESVSVGGNLLGQGAFGAVFLAHTNGRALAVKKLKDQIGKQFVTEIQVLTRFEHPNLLPLLGYSMNGPSLCLVYEYLSMGCLERLLANSKSLLVWPKRVSIALGAARGLNHLHVSGREPLVHRDVKSANILLDGNLVPKLGDFGLARLGSGGASTATGVIASVVSGTSCYMAPEAFRGHVTTKMDIFSFGVVLLELLTGLAPYDPHRTERDLLSHMQENCKSICDFLDSSAGPWNAAVANSLYGLSATCIKDNKRERPDMNEIVKNLEELCSF